MDGPELGIDGDASARLRVAYACGAMKVTTRADSRSTGPRAHVTGMIGGLRAIGHVVTPLLVGDHVPAGLSRVGHADGVMASGSWKGRLADTARVAAAPVFGAWTRLGARGSDVFYERQATYQMLGALRPRRAPWVIESNGPFWYEASAERGALSYPGLAKRLELGAYRRADLVVAVSQALKDVLVEHARLPDDDVIVIPNAVDPARFAPLSRRRAGGDVIVGFVGHLIAWAGLHHLVAATALARQRGARVSVTIVGDGPARAELADQVHRLQLEDHVHLLGHRSWGDIPGLLAECDVAFSGQIPMAIGSMYHSPLKLYEYSAASLPVVATDFPDARALVEGAGAGWLVAPGDVEELARVLLEISDQRSALSGSGARARAHIVREHSWPHRARVLVDELHRRGLLRNSGSGVA